MTRQGWMRSLLGGSAAAALTVLASPAAAAECGDLARMSLPGGKITAAELVAPGAFRQPATPGAPPGVGAGAYGNLPVFGRVQATLTPTSDSDIKVEVWLPA